MPLAIFTICTQWQAGHSIRAWSFPIFRNVRSSISIPLPISAFVVGHWQINAPSFGAVAFRRGAGAAGCARAGTWMDTTLLGATSMLMVAAF